MKILILAALEKEISVLNKLTKAKKQEDFCYAKVNENEVYTALTGVGILNAFTTTTSLIEKIKPDAVINIGTAGGHTIDIKDGDIVVCDEAIYHGGYIMDNNPPSMWKQIKEVNLVIKSDESLSKIFDKSNINATVHHGKTLSGDFFTKDKQLIKTLHDKYHHLCEDMETIAVYKFVKKRRFPLSLSELFQITN